MKEGGKDACQDGNSWVIPAGAMTKPGNSAEEKHGTKTWQT